MSELKYIPAKPGQRLPAGAYWVIDRSGAEAIIRRGESFALGHSTHYCPIEKPAEPDPPDPQDCPLCGGEAMLCHEDGGLMSVSCRTCAFQSPSYDEPEVALSLWNRIRFVPEGSES